MKFIEEFGKFNWIQKSFFIVVVLGIGLYGLWHTGLIKFPAATARDCSTVPKVDNAVTIRMENNKFDPANLNVKVCDTLLFLNLDEEEKWPAVGPHPDHNSYPEFDSKHALKKFDFFQFQVTRPGTYSFHDHLHEEVMGKVIIKD